MKLGRVTFAALALAGTAGMALADTDEEVLRELRELRERVRVLEARDDAPSPHEGIERAVEEYLATRELEGKRGGSVFAPRTQRITLGGMIRARGEVQRHSPTPPDTAGERTNDFVLGRTRIWADARIEDRLRAYVEIQDVRVFGSEPSTVADTAGVDLSQGYVDLERILDETDLRLGRQAVSLSDQRFIGALEWSNPGRRFDGATVTHTAGSATLKGFAYVLADGFVKGDPGDNDAALYGGWAVFSGVDTFGTIETFALLVNNSVQMPSELRPGHFAKNGPTRFWTFGSRVHGKAESSGVDWDFQGAIQTGRLAGDDLGAWALRGEIGVSVGTGRVGFEADFATGDRHPDDGDRDQFQVLFPTNHGYYGIHDLMAWSNTRSWSVNYAVPLSGNVQFKTAYWRFFLDEAEGGWVSASGAPVRPGARGAGRSLGHEIDAILTWKQSEHVSIEFGWAHFIDGQFVRNTEPDGHARDSDFFYLQTLITF